ncbi:helix-turn-helix domain-containing protein [Companilactobacillus ginsenosidimutans]|uniref:Insertion element IS150 protein InsJ-like helix-turn-helix domain-containing protein n=1 Tax=Companilactobacillus ginsenosidimutans TaxID=1007676 RepID=A0A0H4QEY2_9LACO|nr:helix-turn-helix domain-containing protein [Companilactobacillus ginsenosidimutans]AKP66492.1 hypothetical protein ABM34_02265 [Companilactobacillus ginsenosidimutans]
MKFTTDQQKAIAKYAIEHDNNYKETGEKYDITYQQVAAWVRKFKTELSETASITSSKKTSSKKTPVKSVKKSDKKKTSKRTTTKKESTSRQKVEESSKQTNETSTLDVLSRRDPVLEKQLEDVKRRLGLIK